MEEKKKKIDKSYIKLIIIVLIIVIIDHITKVIIVNNNIEVMPNILNFSVVQNTDAAYGIGSNSTFMYVVTNFIILSVIFKFITAQNEYVDNKLKFFLTLILAGGISNVIDRLIRGYVVEFIDFTPSLPLPIFNFADICTVIGWVSVAAIFAVFTVKEWRSNK